jgi:hypothetical protein
MTEDLKGTSSRAAERVPDARRGDPEAERVQSLEDEPREARRQAKAKREAQAEKDRRETQAVRELSALAERELAPLHAVLAEFRAALPVRDVEHSGHGSDPAVRARERSPAG